MVVKTLNINENPLADYGNIICGDRFVGRKSEVAKIHNRVLGKSSGNISVIGLPRIGKSSLVWQALLADRDENKNCKTFITRLDLGEFDNSHDLFSAIVAYVHDELYEYLDEPLKLKIEKTILDISDQNIRNQEKKRNIQKFFKIVKANKFKIIIILDEFDHIKAFFKLEDFQFLRELSIHPDTKVVFVTISRRTIQEIELENGTISTLAGVFSNLFLAPFNSADLIDYWEVLEILGV
ncbi:MAG: AAA family ATPase, partial [Candidatus Lokiarchaeota archaeon]|nr:AAA family ATPase [Candidatus Lokiarchaeota archaeon]